MHLEFQEPLRINLTQPPALGGIPTSRGCDVCSSASDSSNASTPAPLPGFAGECASDFTIG